jgi:ABC-type phosphate/phosphonate transport system ATPase subunit
MPKKKHKKHTPITTEQQRKFFGAELGRLRAGKSTLTRMSEEELRQHLKEVKGKKLPARKKTKKALTRSRELRKQFKRRYG